MLEYRKRQREARRSGSKTECSSPVSTVPPLTADAFPVGLETPSDPPAPTPPCNPTIVKEPATLEEADVQGERGEKEEGQWCVSQSVNLKPRIFISGVRPALHAAVTFLDAQVFPSSDVYLRTSSTSVEQARERSYHRALLLSKDKDTGEHDDGERVSVKGKVWETAVCALSPGVR